jgi:hypothetical protein
MLDASYIAQVHRGHDTGAKAIAELEKSLQQRLYLCIRHIARRQHLLPLRWASCAVAPSCQPLRKRRCRGRRAAQLRLTHVV